MADIAKVRCLVMSRIGTPVTSPAVVHIKLAMRDGPATAQVETRVAELAADRIARIPTLVDEFVAGSVDVF
jgi:S-adenosylmethionine synthetase